MTSYRSIKRLKTLIPTLRERKRYLLIKIISDEIFEYEEIEREFWNSLLNSFGKLAFLTSFKILKDTYDKNKKTIIVKCNHLSKHFVYFALGRIKEINKKKCIIKLLNVSGTIKSLKDYLKSI
ncbi:MAG: Rpp14/Pop5 family protein [Candidatus Aenigmatarchaeota archaeon]